jgi:DNA-binding NtrC family response regulator
VVPIMTTVLIVEDEANIRKFAAVNLAARGYDILEADNARDGLERLRSEQPDLLILDVKMPGMSGLDLLDIMTEEQEDIPVIVMTASEGAMESVQASSYPHIAEVLRKPTGAPQLVEVVASTLVGG